MSGSPVRVTVLVENEVISGLSASQGRGELVAEHGLSFFVESEGTCGILDTGQTDAIIGNAAALGIALSRVSWIVLSHGHYDHTGGLADVLALVPQARVYAHPYAFEPKFSHPDADTWRPIGAPVSEEWLINVDTALELSQEPVQVAANIQTTGEVPRVAPFETPSPRFYAERNGARLPDVLLDDQSLILRTSRGIVALLGCAHSGVINTLHHVASLTGEMRFHAVMGGTHLMGASEERIQHTVDGFRDFEVERIGLAHCTGADATEAFRAAFGDRCFTCSVGTRVEFDQEWRATAETTWDG